MNLSNKEKMREIRQKISTFQNWKLKKRMEKRKKTKKDFLSSGSIKMTYLLRIA